MKTFVTAAAALVLATTAYAADARKVSVEKFPRVTKTVTDQPITVPGGNTEFMASIATFPPGSRLPEHQHPYPHLVYVMQGVLTVMNTETGKKFDVKAGTFVAEMQDTWHYGVNNGKVPVKLFVVDEVPTGTSVNMVAKKP